MDKKPTRPGYLPYALLTAVTLAAYLPTLSNGFINLDDNVYVTGNMAVRGGLTSHGLSWAFTTFHASNWHPLTWLSHMLDIQVFGLNPLGHHLTALLLHIANTLLLFTVLRRMTGWAWRSALVAALFAVHPLHVESVAWVAERKDVLSTLFWMLTMLTYALYAQRPSPGRYALILLSFTLGLMAKPMLVTLPLVLILLSLWPLGRDNHKTTKPRKGKKAELDFVFSPFRAFAIEKAPLLALALTSCIVTVVAQSRGGAVNTLERIPVAVRIDNAAVSYATYLLKAIWPAKLAAVYPHPLNSLPEWQIAGSIALLLGVSLAVWHLRRSRPYLLFGWLWYLITLMPVIGLVQVGTQAMADRYTYIPLIGVFVAVVWLLGDLLQQTPRLATMTACAIVGMLAVLTSVQVGYWHDSITLFRHSLAVAPESSLAHNNLGFALDGAGRRKESLRHFLEAIRISPNYPDARVNLGALLAAQGKLAEAESQFRHALKVAPNNPYALFSLGRVMLERSKLAEARRFLERSVARNPDFAPAHYRLALALESLSLPAEAIVHYQAAIRIEPRDTACANNLAWVLATCSDPALRDPVQAIAIAEKACARSMSKEPMLMDTLASAYAADGRFEDAVSIERRALDAARKLPGVPTADLESRLRLFQSGKPYTEAQ